MGSRFIILCLLSVLSGCVSTPPSLYNDIPSQQCEKQLQAFYQEVKTTHASLLPFHYDARFPHLAFDRFSTSLPAALTTQEGKSQWLAYVHGLGEKQLHTALAWQNGLTPQRRESLQQCQEQLAQSSIESELFWTQVDEMPVVIPSAYQPWKRVFGLYPIASLVVKGQIEEEQAHIQREFTRPLAHPFHYDVLVNAENARNDAHLTIQKMMEQARKESALNWPMLSEPEADQLLSHYAPVFTVETLSKADLPGALELDDDASPTINTNTPTLYQDISYTQFNGDTLLQLNYVLWFSARPAESTFDPYSGAFDAVNIRITLDEQGTPLIVDAIHQCGCFHMVYALSPALSFIESEHEKPIQQHLAKPQPSDRLHVSLSGGRHMITDLHFTSNIPAAIGLNTQPLDALLTLKASNGNVLSPFNQHGVLAESARGERWFLWPFGVRNPGAMRQQGQHAIAFIGERHFDDARIFNAILTTSDRQETPSE
ncbi:hypothetical protein A1OW_01055 [Enterovibrio norvegicus]|uniref:hypothetical protein n=1 Tax=Enterovibrio norvegicus TaxID=188144 RepID=UPI0002E91BAF|nr:hypothetical protein [Enterovibrio norvegicus]OEF50409.1 hypothetical protein A1OW_01055 [Enterovibrio norvegicus]